MNQRIDCKAAVFERFFIRTANARLIITPNSGRITNGISGIAGVDVVEGEDD
jgi:hypothetical protein